jgi:hypothetical protein
MWHVWEEGKVHMEFQWGDLKERDHFEDLGIDGSLLLKLISRNGIGRHGLD